MPIYDYHAVNEIGDKITGTLVADELEHLDHMLNTRDLFLLEAHEQTVTSHFFEQFYHSGILLYPNMPSIYDMKTHNHQY